MRGERDRGVETVVSHVLSVGITALLVVGLVGSAGGFLDTQREMSAQTEVETVANRLANGLMEADALATNSEKVTMTVSLQDRVAGSTYSAVLRKPSVCPSASGICLNVSAAEYDAHASVALPNETALSLESGPGGRFVISSTGSGGTAEPDRRRVEMSLRVGIGSNINAPRSGSAVSTSTSPIARFEIRPDVPQTGEWVTLDAGESRDPDGSIVKYKWDTNGDGNFDIITTSPMATDQFSSPGPRNVTLQVIDDSGLTANETKWIHVSGLLFSPPFHRAPTPSVHGLEFTVTNQYPHPVNISRLLIDPANPSQDQLLETRPSGLSPPDYEYQNEPHEIEFDINDDGTIDWFEDFGAGWELEIPEAGALYYIENTPHFGLVELQPGETARITIQGTPTPMVNEQATIGIRYKINGRYGVNVFNSTVIP